MKLLTVVRAVPFPNSRTRSFDQERREVLASVLGAWNAGGEDGDRMEACRYLLQHLMTDDCGPSRPPAGDSGGGYA